MARKWTREEDCFIQKYYTDTPVNQIAETLHRTKQAVVIRASKLGVTKNGLPNGIGMADLIQAYIRLQSTRKVGEKFGIHKSKVGYYLKKAGVINEPILYSLDHSFFETLTPDSIYWAGFIAADGTIKKKNVISVELSAKDKDHLGKYKTAIAYTGPTYEKTNDGCKSVAVEFSSAANRKALENYNIHRAKTFDLAFPGFLLGHANQNHFMRGYFDGDGGTHITKKANRVTPQINFSIRGTRRFLEDYQAILEAQCGIGHQENKVKLSNGIYRLVYGGNQIVRKIADFLYAGSQETNRMERKYARTYEHFGKI